MKNTRLSARAVGEQLTSVRADLGLLPIHLNQLGMAKVLVLRRFHRAFITSDYSFIWVKVYCQLDSPQALWNQDSSGQFERQSASKHGKRYITSFMIFISLPNSETSATQWLSSFIRNGGWRKACRVSVYQPWRCLTWSLAHPQVLHSAVEVRILGCLHVLSKSKIWIT